MMVQRLKIGHSHIVVVILRLPSGVLFLHLRNLFGAWWRRHCRILVNCLGQGALSVIWLGNLRVKRGCGGIGSEWSLVSHYFNLRIWGVLVCVGRVEESAGEIVLILISAFSSFWLRSICGPLHGSFGGRLLCGGDLVCGSWFGEERISHTLLTFKVFELVLTYLRRVLEEMLKVVLLDAWVIQCSRPWRLSIVKSIILQMNLNLLLLARTTNYLHTQKRVFWGWSGNYSNNSY